MSIRMKMRKGEISLDGFGDRVAFYGKCGVREVEGTGVKILRSYNTDYYAAEYKGHIVLLSDWYTATSARHLVAFSNYTNAAYHGKNGTGRKDPYNWHNLPRVDKFKYYLYDTSCAKDVMAVVETIIAKENNDKAA